MGRVPHKFGRSADVERVYGQRNRVKDGSIIAFSKGLHLYEHCWDLAKNGLTYASGINMLIALVGLNTDELSLLAQEAGEPAYRGKQLAEWIYRRGAHTFDDMTNLPRSLRNHLAGKYKIGRSQIITVQNSKDGTIKLLLKMHDDATVETVGFAVP